MSDWGPLLRHQTASRYGDNHCPDSHCASGHSVLQGTPAPIMPGKDIFQWNSPWDVLLGWVSYFAPLGEGELLSLHWDTIILLQNRPVATNCAWNGTCTTESGKRWGSWSGISTPSPSLQARLCCLLQQTSMLCTARSGSWSCQSPSPQGQGQVGTFCFPLVQSFASILSLPLAERTLWHR